MFETKTSTVPITKEIVRAAYRKVKANDGAAGVALLIETATDNSTRTCCQRTYAFYKKWCKFRYKW